MKKRWIVIPIIAGLTALVVTGGALFAHGNGGGPGGKGGQVSERVAEILGIEHSALQEAYRQAIDEKHEAALRERLARLVENGRITQEESDAILTWFLDKPDAASHVPGIMFRNQEWVERVLARLVEAEHLTQGEADGVMSWFMDRPEVLEDLRGFHRGGPGGHFRGRFHGRFQGQLMPGVNFGERGGAETRLYQKDLGTGVSELSTTGVLQ